MAHDPPPPPTVAQLVGAWIKRHREARSWTQRGLATRWGVSQPMLCHFEAGKFDIDLPAWVSLCKIFEVPLEVAAAELAGLLTPASEAKPSDAGPVADRIAALLVQLARAPLGELAPCEEVQRRRGVFVDDLLDLQAAPRAARIAGKLERVRTALTLHPGSEQAAAVATEHAAALEELYRLARGTR